MAATALLKFTQGINVGGNGRALIVSDNAPVLIANSDNSGVQSYRIELLYGPPGSSFIIIPGVDTPVILAEGDGTPSASLTPSVGVPGCYRIRLTVWAGPGRTGQSDVDIRNFCIPTANKRLVLPPYQKFPDPLPLSGEGVTGEKPDELNFDDARWGWSGPQYTAGTYSFRLVNAALLALDLITGGALVTSSVQGEVAPYPEDYAFLMSVGENIPGGVWSKINADNSAGLIESGAIDLTHLHAGTDKGQIIFWDSFSWRLTDGSPTNGQSIRWLAETSSWEYYTPAGSGTTWADVLAANNLSDGNDPTLSLGDKLVIQGASGAYTYIWDDDGFTVETDTGLSLFLVNGEGVQLSTGMPAGAASPGKIFLGSGLNGQMLLLTAGITGSGVSGGVVLGTGAVGASGSSGALTMFTGAVDTGSTGTISLYTGPQGNAATGGASGDINLYTGSTQGSAPTGAIHLYTGTSSNGSSGDIWLVTGATSTDKSGSIYLTCGISQAGDGGDVHVTPGKGVSIGRSGRVVLHSPESASSYAQIWNNGDFNIDLFSEPSMGMGSLRLNTVVTNGRAAPTRICMNPTTSSYGGTIQIETGYAAAGDAWVGGGINLITQDGAGSGRMYFRVGTAPNLPSTAASTGEFVVYSGNNDNTHWPSDGGDTMFFCGYATNGDGGQFYVSGGECKGGSGGRGGEIFLSAGWSQSTAGSGGAVTIQSGYGFNGSSGGNMYLNAGYGSAGGDVIFQAGNSNTSGNDGGDLTIGAGANAGGAGNRAGNIYIYCAGAGGSGATASTGGGITLQAGWAPGNGGNIQILSGATISQATSTTSSGYIELGTADTGYANSTTGYLKLHTGAATVMGTSGTGYIQLYTGDINTGNTGNIQINTGSQTNAGTGGSTGSISIYSGDNQGGGNTGDTTLASGAVYGSGSTGNATVATGAVQGSSGSTGVLSLHTGQVAGNGSTGVALFFTGDVVGYGGSGNVVIYTGQTAHNDAGDVIIYGGYATEGAGGTISLRPGNTDSGTKGSLEFHLPDDSHMWAWPTADVPGGFLRSAVGSSQMAFDTLGGATTTDSGATVNMTEAQVNACATMAFGRNGTQVVNLPTTAGVKDGAVVTCVAYDSNVSGTNTVTINGPTTPVVLTAVDQVARIQWVINRWVKL